MLPCFVKYIIAKIIHHFPDGRILPSVINTESENELPADAPDTERKPSAKSWDALYGRIRALALRKSAAMLGEAGAEGEEFDRSARTLRTLMSAAAVAQRMKREEAKERDLDDRRASRQGFTEADIEDAYRRLSQTVDRIERRDSRGGGEDASAESGSPPRTSARPGGDALGAERP